MAKKKTDCFDCGSNVAEVKVAAYRSGGMNGKLNDKIQNACGECGQIWTQVPDNDRPKATARIYT